MKSIVLNEEKGITMYGYNELFDFGTALSVVHNTAGLLFFAYIGESSSALENDVYFAHQYAGWLKIDRRELVADSGFRITEYFCWDYKKECFHNVGVSGFDKACNRVGGKTFLWSDSFLSALDVIGNPKYIIVLK